MGDLPARVEEAGQAGKGQGGVKTTKGGPSLALAGRWLAA